MTAPIDSFRALLIEQVRELYDAEQLFVGALADLAGCATDPSLSAFLQTRLADTSAHLARIEEIFTGLDVPPAAAPSSGVRGLIRDSERHIAEVAPSGTLRDAAVAGLALQFVHYGIAGYHTALAHAEVLGLNDIVRRLDSMLVDELSADRTLKLVAERVAMTDRRRDGCWNADAAGDWPAATDVISRRLH
jgi:ferritin-like metal-binding protein YciE